MRLNLGAWDKRLDGYLSVDVCGPHADQIVDLDSTPWPWPDSSVEAVFAHDVFEHLRDRRAVMNELWRILAPGARADIKVPSTRGAGAWCDPTHVSFWNAGFFEYFEHGNFARERFRGSDYYGVHADFRIVSLSQELYHNKFNEEVWHVHTVLEAVK